MVIFSFNYAKNTLGLKVDIVLWNPSQSLSLENRSRKTKHIDDNANILAPKRTIYRIFLFITKWTMTVCEKNNEQRLKLFVVAAFGICRHHRFVHETNIVVYPYRILGLGCLEFKIRHFIEKSRNRIVSTLPHTPWSIKNEYYITINLMKKWSHWKNIKIMVVKLPITRTVVSLKNWWL